MSLTHPVRLWIITRKTSVGHKAKSVLRHMAGFYNNNMQRETVCRHQDNTEQRQGDEGVTLQVIDTKPDLFLSVNHVSFIARVPCASCLF